MLLPSHQAIKFNSAHIMRDSWDVRWQQTYQCPISYRAAKHTNLLSMKFLSWVKQDYQPNFHMISRISKQQLKTSNKQYATNGNLVGNPVFIKEEFHAKQIVVLSSSMKLGPGKIHCSW